MNKHRTHLPTRFLMRTAEEDLMVAIIKQAWCDAFMIITAQEYYALHQKKEQKNAKRMFEAPTTDEWRQSLGTLAEAVGMDDDDIVEGYLKYKRLRLAGKTEIEPEEAFDVLIKSLM